MEYGLTDEAEEDIREIIRYTLRTWGRSHVQKYWEALNHCLVRLGRGGVKSAVVYPSLPDVFSFRCQHHFIFFTEDEAGYLVIAVLHERQNPAVHLLGREPRA